MKVKTCRICLVMGENMSFIGNVLKDYVEGVFKSNGFTQDLNERHYACFECKALMIKSYNFIQRSLRAQKIMYNILATEKMNLRSLQSIDRVQLGLCSTLSYCRVDIDFYIEENEKELKSTIGAEAHTTSDFIHLFDMPEVKTEIDDETYKNCYTEDNMTLEEENITETDPNTNASTTLIQFKIKKQGDTHKTSKQKNYKRTQTKSRLKGELSAEIKPDNVILGCRRRKLKYVDSENESDPEPPKKEKKRKFKKRNSDEEYEPKEVSEESESPYDSYDDFGRRITKSKEKSLLEYPRKCDHCTYIIEQANMHFKHYLFCHTAEEYPYLRKANFVCSFCGLALRSIQRLRHHELTHGEKNFKCDKCDKKFHNRDQLGRHRIRKHGTRQLICDYCSKVFREKADIVLHIRTHTGEKPFKCHICGAGFAHLGNVGIHIRSRHQNQSGVEKKKKTSKSLKKKNSATAKE